eukprot:m.259139 g.259139  ORF g.259139 m.259139 type:complete len:91 (+) comp19201_c2_seq7:1920-2192(+)
MQNLMQGGGQAQSAADAAMLTCLQSITDNQRVRLFAFIFGTRLVREGARCLGDAMEGNDPSFQYALLAVFMFHQANKKGYEAKFGVHLER